MTTARAIVSDALLDMGIVAQEEPITAAMAEQGLRLLHTMLDSWSLERLTIYYTPPTSLAWPAGQQMRSWGPSGDIVGLRPLALEPYASYQDGTGLELPLVVLTQQAEYAALTLKSQTSSALQVLYYAPALPNGLVCGWPVPTADWTVIVYPWMPFRRFTTLDDTVEFPPGYERALRAGLGLELAPSYGLQPSPLTVGILAEAKSNLKRMNQRVPTLGMDPSLVDDGARDPYAIYTDVS